MRVWLGLYGTNYQLDEKVADYSALAILETMIAFDTSPNGLDHDACVAWLSEYLGAIGFQVDTLGADLGRPLIVARREARGLSGHVVLYGHYDVSSIRREQEWSFPPRTLTAADGRLFARGVADNKGPLACRLSAIAAIEFSPELTWIIQGEEEMGSQVAHLLLPEIMRGMRPTLWVDETGYHDHEDRTLRVIGRTMGSENVSLPPDTELENLMQALCSLAARWGVASRRECRGLNKSAVEGGCPFNRYLPFGARYLAVGVNDTQSRIHGLNESVPSWTFPLHATEIDLIFQWANMVGRGSL